MLPAFSRARAISRVALCFALLVVATRAGAATLLDPSFRFRTLSTEHFLIYFHQGEDRLAVRLAAIAEDVWPRVGQALGITAPRRTHVVLADQSELANGWATPLPYDLIFVTAAVPAGSEFIGRTDDWLRLVFTHEFTHIVHLDRSQGWARLFRGIFGRTAVAFPNVWLPVWQIEGIAEWEESALTGEGRRHAGDFRAIEREAARRGRLEPLDRVNGGLTDWPAGLAPYAFGLGFHEYLAERFGESRFGDLAARTSRSLPFFGSRAFRRVYGESLGNLWRDYEKSISNQPNPSNLSNQPNLSNLSNLSNLPSPIRLTHHGHTVLGPRFAPPTCAGCPTEIVYTVRNPDGFPALDAIAVDGSGPRQLATRYLGSTVGIGQDSIVFDQQELHRNVGLYSDLYALDRRTGTVRALTRGQRLQDPDLSPDGESIICVRQKAGQRDLMLVRLRSEASKTVGVSGSSRTVGEIVTLISEPDTQFNAPRWSPDGRSVAVERHRLGAQSEIVVVDITTRTRRVVASDPSSRIVTPAWRPDGRAIVAAADFGGDTFNLYEFELSISGAAPRPLTRTSGGALWPDVSKDGDLVAFVGYTPEGFDLFTAPYRPVEGFRIIEQQSGSVSTSDNIATPASATLSSPAYSPWATLPPTSWAPLVEIGDQVRAGVSTSGSDALGRHGYSVSASWLVSGPEGALLPSAVVPDWHIGYAYDRWRPTLFASASSDTLFAAGPPDAKGRPTPATLREHELQAGVFLPFRHVRSSHRAIVSIVRTDDRYSTSSVTALIHRTASRLGVATNTARLYGYSVSPEHGVALGATAELARRSLGSSADATTVTADGRGYLPGLGSHHVWALRGAIGLSSGTAESRRTFLLGGAAPSVDVLDFGREAVSLLRGFPPRAFAGTHAAIVNADYRWPVARPQRGVGTWPIFLNTVHAALFVDAGHAWTDQFRGREVKTSAGAELSFAAVLGYFFPLTTTVGAAWGHDGADRTDRRTLYVRVGRAF
jgi:Tol biopolymer transport system component